ncbi:hypothetical protein WR25_04828 [Diploscapter pachys]|uniref:Uncharacterized protein n=1 Tax=Diploscapter pachys TaxID=2018661 RepID=A0A2A2J7C1_9BILA|nr:hypothetical protein WR25_04828 [Diploscapter pachys]
MGSSESKPTDGNVDELEANRMKENKQIYKIVDMHGSGTLIRLIRECKTTNNYTLIDAYIKDSLQPYLYNAGKGKIVAITELIKIRNQERNAKLSAIARKKSKGKSGPNILDELDQQNANAGDLKKGLSPLHLAIINHDVKMVLTLLKKGADVNQRCLGAFFCTEDQKASRTDNMEHEEVELSVKTNYMGSMYFGEYPLSFAVCMEQPDMFRLLVAFKVNLNAQDTNGNTVCHLAVIHEKEKMLEMCLEAGANPTIANKQNLTPLTLAAKLAKKKMFDFMLQIESEQVWTYGGSNCIAYPLTKIDTIDEKTGNMNEDSALSLIVYGETREHLELMDGLIENILDEKWNAYGKNLYYS